MNVEETILALNTHFPALAAVSPRPLRVFTSFTEPKQFEEALRFANGTLGDDDRTRHGLASVPVPEGAQPGRMVLETAGSAPAVPHERTP